MMSARTKLLGIDYGTVRVGLAVTDPERKFAFPLATYQQLEIRTTGTASDTSMR